MSSSGETSTTAAESTRKDEPHLTFEPQAKMKQSNTNESIASSRSSASTVSSNKANFHFQQKLSKKAPHSTNLALSDFLNPLLGYGELSITSLTTSSSNSLHLSSSFCLNPNLDAYFMHTIGSSYYNGQSAYALQLSIPELKELFQLIKKMFVKSVINQINKYLNDYLTQQQVIYKFLFLTDFF